MKPEMSGFTMETSEATIATNTALPTSTANFNHSSGNSCPPFSNDTRQEYANQMSLGVHNAANQHNIQTSTMDLGNALQNSTTMPDTEFNLFNYDLGRLFNSGHQLHPIHREMLMERQAWGWEKWIRYDMNKQNRHCKRLRSVLMNIMQVDAKQRDMRDDEAKILCEGAIRRFMLSKTIAGQWHNLGMQLANISTHQNAMLQRIEDRAINELDSQNDMTSQLYLMLNNYLNACKEYEKAYNKEHGPPSWFSKLFSNKGNNNQYSGNQFHGQMANNYYGAQRPDHQNVHHQSPVSLPQRNQMNNYQQPQMYGSYNANGVMIPNTHSANILINPHMSNPNFKNNGHMGMNHINRLQNSETHHKSKQMLRALNDFVESLTRYMKEIIEKEISAIKYFVKAKADYHSKCLEIYSELSKNFDKIDADESVQELLRGMGFKQIQTDIENKIKLSENPTVQQDPQQMMYTQMSGSIPIGQGNQMYGGYQNYQQGYSGAPGALHGGRHF